MPEPSLFRHYQIVQDAEGSTVELVRNAEQVAVLAYDTQQQEFVHCHVLLEAVADKPAFEESCRSLQRQGDALLARLVDFGEDEGNPFYITSNVDGETLRSYLNRQQEMPGWLAVLTACQVLDAVVALVQGADVLPEDPLTALRVVQTGPHQLQVQVADYQLVNGTAPRAKGLKPAFEKSSKQLRTFFQEHSQAGPMQPDQPLPGADFMELLSACISGATRSVASGLRDLRTALHKLSPEGHSSEIPAAHKPRALLAPHLATYQEVARGVVNLVRIQSQRLDMANPYSMRGTLTKTGRSVLVEQMAPARLVGPGVKTLLEKTLQATKKQDHASLITLVLVHEGDVVTCMAEEVAEGISLSELLKERHTLSVHEAYLLLASLDGSLSALEKAALDTPRMRLEDIFLITGFPREDARSAKLLLTKLNEWPAFSLLLRAHPTLASLAGRGLNPAVLLPPVKSGVQSWDAAWLSALGRFLVGLEALPGTAPASASGGRDRESVERLFDEEISKVISGQPSSRSDFLARYARILQHHDLVKPTPAPITEPLEHLKPQSASRTRPITGATSGAIQPPVMSLTSGLAPTQEKPTIGFAELLFRDTSVMERGTDHDWAKSAADAPPTINPREVLLPPRDFVPLWLRSFVFIGGSMVVGAILAHLSGQAFWLLPPTTKPAPAPRPVSQAAVPKAIPVPKPRPLPAEAAPGPAAPAVTAPTLPQETTAPDPTRHLLQPPPSAGLRGKLE